MHDSCVFHKTHIMTFLTNLWGFRSLVALGLSLTTVNFNGYYQTRSTFGLQLKLSRKSSLSLPWRALTVRWPFSGYFGFRSIWKESIYHACTPFRCHVMRWLLFAWSIQTRLPNHRLSHPNQRLQLSSKIDDRELEGVKFSIFFLIWQTTVHKSAQSWHPLNIIRI